jgi:hypothetical protein
MLQVVVFLISRPHYGAGRPGGSGAYAFRKKVIRFSYGWGKEGKDLRGVEYVYDYLRARGCVTRRVSASG